MKPKLLITGSSGFLGWNLVRHAKSAWDVHGTVNTHRNAQPGATYHSCNITCRSEIAGVFRSVQPDALIHLAAESSPNECQRNPRKTWHVNVAASENIANLCATAKIPMIFSSSSQVYAGNKAPYTETSETLPVNEYGKQKLEAERRILKQHPNATVCRVPLMYGAAPSGAESALQSVLNALTADEELSLFTDEWRSALGAYSASTGLCQMLEHPGKLFILAGDETLSRFEFGCRVAQFFKLDASLIKPVRQNDILMPAARPSDLTMSNAKAKSHGFSPLNLEDELACAMRLMSDLSDLQQT